MPFTTLNSGSLHALFDNAGIGVLVTGPEGVILMSNEYIQRQFGYNEEELLRRSAEVLIPGIFTNKHKPHYENGRGVVLAPETELSGIKKDGVEFPVEVGLGRYTIGEETYVFTFISDISERRAAEQAIAKLNAQKVKESSRWPASTAEQPGGRIKETEHEDTELQRVNTFRNNIWNHAGAIIFVCDKDGLIRFFNPAAEKWLGYSADEVVDKLTLEHFHIPEELRKRALDISAQTGKPIASNIEVLTAATQNESEGLEWHYLKKDGSAFFVSLNVTPLKDPQNKVVSYLGIAIDISQKKKAEIELLAALEKEKELNELRSRFVSMASHEFRTPLSAVLSSAYLLSKYTKSEEQSQRERHIGRIIASVASLTEILNDFLSVGKIEEGFVHPAYKEYDVKAQMQDIMQGLQHLLKRGQHISYLHSGKETVFLDPSMMKHIVTNLLSNAIKFSPDETEIALATEKNDDVFVLSVKDNGIGIPEEEQGNLFKRFFRSSNATNIQGTGLGLHIVSKYAELMNGSVSCISGPGKGTKFIVTFNTKNSR